MRYNNILIEHKENYALITINRPKQLNALNAQTILELNHAIVEADQKTSVRCILITGAGDKAFVAGADIKEFADFNTEQGKELARKGQELLFNLLSNLSTPSIALVNGFALGGGLELAMACHIRIASNNAKLGLPEVSLGVIPGYGGTQRLRELVGKGKALEMICTATMLSAEEALQVSLVNYTCHISELLEKGSQIAQKIARNSPNAISQAIKAVNDGFYTLGFDSEIEAFGQCFQTDDFKEGITAFLEKRKAKFNH